jgi:2-octaprenyl-6-methoxyphenol hydroxylase
MVQDTSHMHDIIVIGAGPAGLAAALAFRRAGLDCVCVGPRSDPGRPDRRTTALLGASVRLLNERLGVWDTLRTRAAPLRTLRIIDRTGRLLRAPDTVFDAGEIGADAFGYNVPNVDLTGALLAALGDGLIASEGVTAISAIQKGMRVRLAEGRELRARLAVGADGRNSLCRESSGIGVRTWSYDQAAVVCNFQHSRPHRDACTELHYRAGPFTLVPLPGNASSLVWVEHGLEAKRLAADDQAFASEIAARTEGLLGEIGAIEPRASFPLSALIAHRLTADRLALIGEAAHVMPPIGAQGLNLGFRDVADLVECVTGGSDPGARGTLAAYEQRRRADVWTRTLAADLLNRTLISGFPPFQLARSAGLAALSLSGPLRRLAMRQGMSSMTL